MKMWSFSEKYQNTIFIFQMDNHFQLHEQQHSLLGNSPQYKQASSSSQYSAASQTLPRDSKRPHTQHSSTLPRHIVHSAGATRYSHVFQRAPTSPRPNPQGKNSDICLDGK